MSEREGASGTREMPADDPDAAMLPRPSSSARRRRGASAADGPVAPQFATGDLPSAQMMQAQKMEAIGQLVAGVAHELNNPLASIIAFSQLIRTDPNLPEDLHRQADLLMQEANRTRVIVGNLLDFARLRPPERVDQALRPIVESVLGLQSYVFRQSKLTVDVDIPDDLPLLSVDRSQLQQVLVNLTVNAAQAIGSQGRPGRISIRARADERGDGQRVRISIADDGPGIPREVVDRLFMPFVTTKAPGEGTGLGLSVSSGIIAAHGGTIRHERRGGPGATFVIELPVASDRGADGRERAGRDPTAAEALSGPDTPLPRAVPGPRVLVLDDEPSIRDFLGRVLARAGYTPVIAATGTAALEIVRTHPPEAILCDHRMAGMTGTEFHEAVAASQPELARRFAFMSGDVLDPELRAFATARGVHLLAKPFDIATVGRTVAALLGPAG